MACKLDYQYCKHHFNKESFMKNSINYSGFLDLVYNSGGAMPADGKKQVTINVESESRTTITEPSYIQRSVNAYEKESGDE